MKKVASVFITLGLSIILTNSAKAIEQDKVKHLSASAAIGTISTLYFSNNVTAFAACNAVGIVKELHDELRTTGFDGKDLAYNAIGCAVGSLIGNGISFMVSDESILLGYSTKF